MASEPKSGPGPEKQSIELQKEFIRKLKDRGISPVCPRCSENDWIIADGFFNHAIQSNFASMRLGGPGIPTLAMICKNCGFLSEHSLGVLGLIPEEKDSGGEK